MIVPRAILSNTMSPTLQALRAVQSAQAGIGFGDLQRLVEAAGFELAREDGSHYVYKKSGVTEIITLQKNGDVAKAYQVRQVILVLEKYQNEPAGESPTRSGDEEK